ncbi:hypothetical protein RvY_13468 [Ramazzottius varieornatus]|uniref:N-acetyltransferase domain-containing protein n=1 Tax=Ramazzottius varieornatus TaxID=947166 RepID=A0A1D1VS07_RAMVA|nr:hypothetical protein RvY_13468 [Ramazzottius varieornatus]
MIQSELSPPGTVSRFVEMFRSMESISVQRHIGQHSKRPKAARSTEAEVRIRMGVVSDCQRVLELMNELSTQPNLTNVPSVTLEDLRNDGFPEEGKGNALFHLMVSEHVKAGIVGFALFYPSYSAWTGRAYVLELLYIQPAYRRRGLGKRLMSNLAKYALENGAKQIRLDVSKDNTEALKFYIQNLALRDFAIKFHIPAVNGKSHEEILRALASYGAK